MKTLKIETKHIPRIVLAVVCIIVAVLCGVKAVKEIKYRETLPDSSVMQLEDIIIIADGGNGTEVPKNTSYAIDDLIAKQFGAMKIDARLTKDKKYVSLADADISEITNGKGVVGSYNYFDLLEFNIKDFMPRENPVIELVSDTVQYAGSNRIQPVIYLHDFNKKAIKEMISDFSEQGLSVYAYASDNIKELQYIRKLDSYVPLIYQVDEITDEVIEECKNEENISICFNAETKNVSVYIEKMNIAEVKYLCYGAQTLKDIEELYKFGVRSFITDTVKAG